MLLFKFLFLMNAMNSPQITGTLWMTSVIYWLLARKLNIRRKFSLGDKKLNETQIVLQYNLSNFLHRSYNTCTKIRNKYNYKTRRLFFFPVNYFAKKKKKALFYVLILTLVGVNGSLPGCDAMWLFDVNGSDVGREGDAPGTCFENYKAVDKSKVI